MHEMTRWSVFRQAYPLQPMPHLPDRQTFARLAENHELVPVFRRLTSDTLTPVSAFRRIDRGGTACLFESVIGGERVGRYSFLAVGPYAELSAYGCEVTIRQGDQLRTFRCQDPLEELRRWVDRTAAFVPELPPFIGGAVGYAGYDIVRYTEDLPNPPEDDRKLPDISFALYDRMVVFDHVQKTLYVIVLADVAHSDDQAAVFDEACERVDELVTQLCHPDPSLEIHDVQLEPPDGDSPLSFHANTSKDEYVAAVKRCVEYIQAGDIFQVVLSQRLSVDTDVKPFDVYRSLRVVNPSPFMFYVRSPETTLVGSSPEIMCRVMHGEVTVRPLAGTRPRGSTAEEDLKLEAELLADPKERAEHVMLVDLGRNDVGRVARYGSVELSDMMVVERYSHVMHITSNVTGQLRPTLNAFDALKACLPAGTVSGAPKIRAMEIIDELEPARRGPYAGAVGYFDFRGNMDTCIALRTIVFHHGRADIQAGAGIVADSVPEKEYEETLNKARGMFRALELARWTPQSKDR